MATYQVSTDDGAVYEVQTEEQTPPKPESLMDKVKNEVLNPMNMIPGNLARKGFNAALAKSQEGYDMLGNMAAEAIDQGGKHPILSAAVGTPIKMANEIAGAAAGLGGIGKGIASEIAAGGKMAPLKSLGQDLATVPGKLKDLGSATIKAFRGETKTGLEAMSKKELQKLIPQLDEELKKTIEYKKLTLPTIKPRLIKENALSKVEAKKAIQEYEANIPGYKFKGEPEITPDTIKELKIVEKYSQEQLNQQFNPAGLQELYDKAKVLNKPGLDQPIITRLMQKVTQAQEATTPGIAGARAKFGGTFEQTKAIKDQVLQQKLALEKDLMEQRVKLQEAVRVLKGKSKFSNAVKKIARSKILRYGGAIGFGSILH
jgi:hypothetical protein